MLSKFRLPCLWEIPFSCILLLSKNMISRAISCKRALENYSKTTNCTHLRAREIFGLWKVYSNLTPNFTRNHVSTNLFCYLQAVPYHLRLRTRFHIRFKRHARRVGQVRNLSMKSCVLKTRAKPVMKTFHENFTVNFPESARLSP